MFQRRVVGLALTIGAAVLILAAVWSPTWWSAVRRSSSVHVGLLSAELCDEEEAATDTYRDVDELDYDRPASAARVTKCREGSLRELLAGQLERGADPQPVSSWFVTLGVLVVTAGMCAVVALVVAAATSGSRRHLRVAGKVAALACGALAGLALAFVVSAPTMFGQLRAGVGLPLVLAGAAAGVAGSLSLLAAGRWREPSSSQLALAVTAAPVGRVPALAAGVLGAALVLVSVLTNQWFRGSQEGRREAVGLQVVEICERGDQLGGPRAGRTTCDDYTIPARVDGARHPTRMKVFVALGTLTAWTGLVATIAFAGVALLVLLRQPVTGRFTLARVVVAGAGAFALCAVGYAATWPNEIENVHVFAGPFLALGGAGTLISAGVMTARWTEAVHAALAAQPAVVEPPPAEPVMPAPLVALAAVTPAPRPDATPPPAPPASPVVAIPACPACGAPMLWVRARAAYLCTVCKARGERAED